ncbi:MAG: molybdenum cofactor guanylyltransferase [Henriciella sp.]|nr:molybdenum cofactor guanylyltransferase [Henriciella sp.]
MTHVSVPPHPVDAPCVVLAGGRSRRFGSRKAEAQLGGQSLLNRTLSRIRPQVSGPIAVNIHYAVAADLDFTPLSDRIGEGYGPIAGLYTALSWAAEHGHGSVVTLPVDCPFFPLDLADRLQQAGASAVPRFKGRLHPVFGFWPTDSRAALKTAIDRGVRAMHEWVSACEARTVDFSDAAPHAFFNINTPADLDTAERLLLTERP